MIIANWKMNLSSCQELDLIKELLELEHPSQGLVVCPSFLSIREAMRLILETNPDSNIFLGGQDCSQKESGNFTGQICASSLKEAGCTFCIIGHHETRVAQNLSESDVAHKLRCALEAKLVPIVCVGAQAKTPEELSAQVAEHLPHIQALKGENIFFAYEPEDSIGAGEAAEHESIRSMAQAIKETTKDLDSKVTVVYGGSVDSKNFSKIIRIDEIEGFLVGTASLNFQEIKNMLDSGADS